MRIRLALISLLVTLGLPSAHGFGSFTNLESAYQALGFNPIAPGNSVVVLFSDVHICLDPGAGITPGVITTNLHPLLVNNINAMNPRPEKILILGDMTSSYSVCPGQITDLAAKQAFAANEFIKVIPELKRITNIDFNDIRWIPGNHDQDPRESDAEFFRQFFTNMPTHQIVEVGGMKFFMVNAGNRDVMDEPQLAWLKQELANTSPTQTVAIAIHQPSLNSNRGNATTFRALFQDFPRRWWFFHGHAHYFGETVWDIGRSNVTMSGVGSVSTNQFNGQSGSPGFMVLCLSNGIAGRIYYHFANQMYDALDEPDWGNPVHFLGSFEDVPGLLWRREKVMAPMPEVLVTNIAYDEGDYYAYITELQWELQLGLHDNQATHFVVESDMNPNYCHVSFSADRSNWVEVAFSPPTNRLIKFRIPPSMAGLNKIYARAQGTASEFVNGWGLVTTSAPPYITFPQLPPISNQTAVAGRAFTFTNAAVDPYAPPDILSYSLLSGPPGAVITYAGKFIWQPPISGAPDVVPVTVKVQDNGVRPMCATQSFNISVVRPAVPALVPAGRGPNGYSFTVSGDTGLTYTVLTSTNLHDWSVLYITNLLSTPFTFVDPQAGSLSRRFYRAVAGPGPAPDTNTAAPSNFDPDALAYLSRLGAVTANQSNVIGDFFKTLKSSGAYTNIEALYPFCWANAASNGQNMVSTLYTIRWFGGILTNNSTGVHFDGVTGYGDTGWKQTDKDHAFLCTWVKVDNTPSGWSCGSASGLVFNGLRHNGNLSTWDAFMPFVGGGPMVAATPVWPAGLMITMNAGNENFYFGNSSIAASGAVTATPPPFSVFIGGRSYEGALDHPWGGKLQGFAVGNKSMTAAQAASLFTAFVNLGAGLGR